jgi:RNA methyltransferase, TrmH family
MAMITSTSNPKIKLVRVLQTQAQQRKRQGAFVAEGVRLIEDAIMAKWPIDYVFFDQTLSERGKALVDNLDQHKTTEIYEVPSALMAELSDTDTPQGILGVMKSKALPLPTTPTFVLLADQVRDPGNLGTILRTAEATGADAVLLTPGTVDAFSPKVLRAGMGAHFHLPIVHLAWHQIHAYLADLPIFLAEADQGDPLWEANFRQPCAILIGGEAFGATQRGEEIATQRITIPLPGRAESLNAAIAAGILMAEVVRQRHTQDKER